MRYRDEYLGVLQRLGVKPTGTQRPRYVRTKKLRIAGTVIVGGMTIALATVVWTVTYDGHSKALVSAERRVVSSTPIADKFMLSVVTFLTATGGSTWPVPRDWNNADNTVEAIGPGGTGLAASLAGTNGPGAAGGGAYSKSINVQLIPRGVAAYVVGAGGSQQATWLSGTGVAPTIEAQGVLATAGSNAIASATGALGGQASGCVGSTKFSGGNGGNGGNWFSSPTTFRVTGGGGGAAGPTGAGSNGGNGGAGPVGGNGGNSASGALGSTGQSVSSSSAGANGTGWTDGITNYGPGAGSGGSIQGTSGSGGLYGGASGSSVSGGVSAGAQGLLVVTFTPYVTSPSENAWKSKPTNLRFRGRVAHSRTYLKRRTYGPLHITPYHTIELGQWVIEPGPGQVDIRQAEAKLAKLRNPGLLKLRTVDPPLED